MHSYFHKVCLIQVSVGGSHFIIDPLALEADELEPLWREVADPVIPVLMHGADYDVRILDRDYGARVAGLLDTQIMAQLLGEEKTGLAALLDKELGVSLDKRYQRADWGRRPLRGAQLEYAAADTAHLARLSDRLHCRLEELGRWGWAVEDSRALEDVRHVQVEADPSAFERIKGVRGLRGRHRDRMFTLYRWRESVAKAMDVPPFKVLGNKVLMLLAADPPTDLAALGEVEGLGPRAVRRWGRELLRSLRDPDRAPEHQPRLRPPAPDKELRRRVQRLVAAREEVARRLGLSPGLLCSRSCLESVAKHAGSRPSRERLAASDLSGWRLEVLGDVLVEALTRQ